MSWPQNPSLLSHRTAHCRRIRRPCPTGVRSLQVQSTTNIAVAKSYVNFGRLSSDNFLLFGGVCCWHDYLPALKRALSSSILRISAQSSLYVTGTNLLCP